VVVVVAKTSRNLLFIGVALTCTRSLGDGRLGCFLGSK
jgi:hypothetical protein